MVSETSDPTNLRLLHLKKIQGHLAADYRGISEQTLTKA